MKKSIFRALIFQFLTVMFFISCDFLLWHHGLYLIFMPAVIFAAVIISGVVFCPSDRYKIVLVSTFFFLLLPCIAPQAEFSFDLYKADTTRSYFELLTDTELGCRIDAEMTARNTDANEIVKDAFADVFFLSNCKTEEPAELYRSRLYDFLLIPVFYIFFLLLILVYVKVEKRDERHN